VGALQKAMDLPLSLEAKEKRTSDGLLSSENLKEEKGGNHLCQQCITLGGQGSHAERH
jgi:hypothetical protein